jgi:DNA-binding NarL/FixJ family response regulator
VPTGRDRTADAKLVELLELGMKDEAIARYLGVSLRTVRRRVASLMSVNGVDTRFQLGWVLARRRR